MSACPWDDAVWDLAMCGWHLRSDFPIPELRAWAGEQSTPAALALRSPQPSQFNSCEEITPFLKRDAEGNCLLDIPSIARYEICRGSKILVSPCDEAVPFEVRLFLLGPVLSLLCLQRGLLPLTGCCLCSEAGAFILCGNAAVGKSTIAAVLAQRGYKVVSDGFAAIQLTASDEIVVLPIVPQLRLWRDSLQALDIAASGLFPNRIGQEKFRVPFAGPVGATRLRRIFFIKDRRGSLPLAVDALDEKSAIDRLCEAVDQPKAAHSLHIANEIKKMASRISAQIPICTISACGTYDGLQSYADALEREFTS